MFSIKGFTPRLYQKNIFKTTINKNTLVCLPTGTGKTKNAILLAVQRLNTFPESKILIISPTKPLSDQINKEFKDSTNLPPAKINLLTGMLKPEERKKIFNNSLIIVATPQTIENDIKNNLITLKEVSLLVIDECHRSKQKYANTIVAKHYIEKSQNQRILALTASPGSTKEKINEICSNLYIEDVEIRTEQDQDIAPYIQEKNIEYIKVELTPQLNNIQKLIRNTYERKLKSLKSFGIYKPIQVINKRDLLDLQIRFQKEIRRGNKLAFAGISIVAQAIKLSYMLELIETQSANSLNLYLQKLDQETSKAAKTILNDSNIIEAKNKLKKDNLTHPKLEKTIKIVEESLKANKDAKTIIFANYRATVDELKSLLSKIPSAKPTMLVGQKLGFTQKEQMQIIEKFNKNIYNIIIGTSITEEGISIGSLDLAIFYDHTGSEIRKIQRSGRVARIKPGKIIYLITKNTRDEALLWTSHKKEKKMHHILKSMKDKIEEQTSLK